jgi:hypothetical protein
MVMSFSNVRVRSSFLILLKKFHVLGDHEMVGVTGDGTNDDPVLKKVHVWFFEHRQQLYCTVNSTKILPVYYRYATERESNS